MMYRVNKQFDFQAAHVLSKHRGLCRYPHGHNYKVEITLCANKLDENNMVCDFQAIKAILSDYIGELDHSIMLNSTDRKNRQNQADNPRVNLFEDKDPTSEVMAETMFTFLRNKLKTNNAVCLGGVEYHINPAVKLEKVRIWETPTAWAEYSG